MTAPLDPRWRDLLRDLGEPAVWNDGVLWTRYGRMVEPFGLTLSDVRPARDAALGICRELGGWLARWNAGPGRADSPWYAVVSDGPVDLEQSESSTVRKDLRRCRRELEVRLLEGAEWGEKTWPVYHGAFAAYKGPTPNPYSEATFRQRMEIMGSRPELVHCWGAFHGDVLVAYRLAFIFGDDEVSFRVKKQLPGLGKLNPSLALLDAAWRHYQMEGSVRLLNSGHRALLHQTQWHSMLLEKLGHRVLPLRLAVAYPPWLGAAVGLARLVGPGLGRIHPALNAILAQDQISRDSLSL